MTASHFPATPTALRIIDLKCRICDDSVFSNATDHDHVWEAVAQLLNWYDPRMFWDIQVELTRREENNGFRTVRRGTGDDNACAD